MAGQGGKYTKHIYVGGQRIVSKLGDLASYGADPRRIPYAGHEADGLTINYKDKYAKQLQSIKDNYKAFDQPYNGKDNDDYVNGQVCLKDIVGCTRESLNKLTFLSFARQFCCNDGTPEAAQARVRTRAASGNFKPNDDYEKMQFYYHPDHLGSSSYITNLDGEVSQHIEYVPFGEVFIEERNNTWNTPYLFNAKEFDEETGLYYYGARYYEPRLSLWMSCDPKQEKYYNNSTYCYTVNNPIIFIDPNGKDWVKHNHTYFYNPLITSKEDVEQYYGKGYEYLFPSGTLYATDHSYSYDLAIGGHVQNSYTKEFIPGTTETAYGSTIINSNQYISQYEPSFMEKWAKSDNFFASWAYGTLNDLYIGIQAASLGVLQREEWKNPFTGACFGNLDGSPNYHQTDAIPGIVGDLIPFSSASKGLSIFKKLNAAEFSHMFKGTLSRLKPANRGIINRGINGIIENTNNNIGSGKIIVDGISVSQTAIEVNKKKDGNN